MARHSSSRKAAVSARELAVFCRQMSLIVGSAITVRQGLEMLIGQAEQKRLRNCLDDICRQMDQGVPFSEAFGAQKGIFPEYLVSMIAVGEQSGTLEVVFEQMADYFDKEYRVLRKVSSALTYPTILTALMLGVMALLVLRILPMFEQILFNMGGIMPPLTRALMDVSKFLAGNSIFILLAIGLIAGAYAIYRHTAWGKMHASRNKLSSPVTGSVRKRMLTARFARSIGILLRAGVPVLSALEAMDDLLGNEYAAGKIRNVREKIRDGANLSDALAESRLFPPLFLRLINVGELTGNIDDMMIKSASIYDDEVDDALEKLTTAIEPVLVIILAVIVGFILLSVMLPMINIMSQIG